MKSSFLKTIPSILLCTISCLCSSSTVLASSDIEAAIKSVYDYAEGDILRYPDDLSHFSEYTCTSDGSENYNVEVPKSLSVYFSYERATDFDYEETIPGGDDTVEDQSDIFDQKRFESALKRAVKDNDPDLVRIERELKALDGSEDVLGRNLSFLKARREIETILPKYGYEKFQRRKMVETDKIVFRKYIVIKGGVVYRFKNEVSPKLLHIFGDGMTKNFHGFEDGWNRLGRRYAAMRGYPIPPLMPKSGQFSHLSSNGLRNIPNFSVDVIQDDPFGLSTPRSMESGLRLPMFEDRPPKTFQAELYLGIYSWEVDWSVLKSYPNAPIPAMVKLTCKEKFSEELADEAATLAWLATHNFSIEDFKNGEYYDEDLDPENEVEKVQENWELLTRGGKVALIKNHQALLAAAAASLVTLSAAEKAYEVAPKTKAGFKRLIRGLRPILKKVPYIGALISVHSVIHASEKVGPPCVGPELYTNIQNLSSKDLYLCLETSQKLTTEFEILKNLLEAKP